MFLRWSQFFVRDRVGRMSVVACYLESRYADLTLLVIERDTFALRLGNSASQIH